MQVNKKQVVAQATTQNVTVVQPVTLRATRIAKIQVALHAQRIAAKQQTFAGVTLAHKQAAYMLHCAQGAAMYGLPAPTTLSVRAVHSVQQHAPSAITNACAAVREWCAANPTANAAAAKLHFSGTNYVNPATVQTQHAKQRKLNLQ